ncbi:MAG: hypothetical protein BWX79_00552 [Alphaproteobacteria bacterium ADurb.Bin100]|nr:MAG: hypothetical protein BWX79_00552 [Alphaproteobacteria bacterium ADurb.Bin100]
MGVEQRLQPEGGLGGAAGLKVGVVDREFEVRQLDVGDLCASGARQVGYHMGELSVPGAGAGATGQDEQFV